MTPAIPKRIGFYTLRSLAHKMCRALPLFTPIIRKAYPNNLTLQAALAAAEAACHELLAQIDQQAGEGV